MPFMVIYRTSDGSSCHEQADAIDEAALFVERLRNNDGVEDDIRIYRMEEISFAFRPYYKVELGMPEKQVAGSPPPEVVPMSRPAAERPVPVVPTAAIPASPEAAEPLVSMDGDTDAGTASRRGLFGR